MHELAVTESLLEIVTRRAAEAGAARVTGLNIVVDQLASIVDDSVQFYWDIVSVGTVAEGARLHFERRPARLECRACGENFALDAGLGPCPRCGSEQVQIVSGAELRLDSLEVEMPAGAPEAGRA